MTILKKLAVCDFCGHQFNISPHLKQYGDWKYRRSGLFGRYDDQHGSIPVAITLQLLDQVLGFNGFIYTTSTEFKGRNIPKCESDFIAILSRRNHDGKIEIIIGECKSLKGEITQDDIIKLNAIAEGFPTDKFTVLAIANDRLDTNVKDFYLWKSLAITCYLLWRNGPGLVHKKTSYRVNLLFC